MVVGFKDELGQVSGGDDDRRNTAEPEVDDGAEFVGNLGQGVMGHVGEEVEVTDYWEAWR